MPVSHPSCRICGLSCLLPRRTCGSGSCRRLWGSYKSRKRRLRAEQAQARETRLRDLSAPAWAVISETHVG